MLNASGYDSGTGSNDTVQERFTTGEAGDVFQDGEHLALARTALATGNVGGQRDVVQVR